MSGIDFSGILFWILAGIMLISSSVIVFCSEVFYSLICLFAVFLATSVLFLTLNSPLIALLHFILFVIVMIFISKKLYLKTQKNEEQDGFNIKFRDIIALISFGAVGILMGFVYKYIILSEGELFSPEIYSLFNDFTLFNLIIKNYNLALIILAIILVVILIGVKILFIRKDKKE